MTKKINPNLTAEQKLILFEEGTERAGSSELNHEKRDSRYKSNQLSTEAKPHHQRDGSLQTSSGKFTQHPVSSGLDKGRD